MFLVNSCLDLFSAPYQTNGRDPLSRSYRVNLPSSLTVNHSSALEYSSRLRVSVWGTGSAYVKTFSGFSWEQAYTYYLIVSKNAEYYQVRHILRICLQNVYLHPLTIISVRWRCCHFSVSTSLVYTSMGILTHSAIGIAIRLNLRTRLTLIRLALIRKP